MRFTPLVPLMLVGALSCAGKPSTPVTSSPASGPPSGGAAPSADATPSLPPGVTTAMVALGDTIFNTRSCRNCHGIGGKGGVRGPDLTDGSWLRITGSYDEIVRLVTSGFTQADIRDPQYRLSMNPRGGVNLSDDQIRAVAAYVWTISPRR